MEADVHIRLVDSWNEDEIVRLYHAGRWWKDEYDPRSIDGLIRGSFAFAVAIDPASGHAVGMGRIISDGVSDGYLQDLVILPEFRHQGIGRKIVATLIKKCHDAGISWISLIAEPDTEIFYKPLGFRRMEGHIPLILSGDP
jgi:ribosomal protein S18 acetylase RimI-like enzyme